MKTSKLLMRISIGLCVVACAVSFYDEFGSKGKYENLSLYLSIIIIVGLFLMGYAASLEKRKSGNEN